MDERLTTLNATAIRLAQLERQRTLLIRECVANGLGVRRTATAAHLSPAQVSRIARHASRHAT
jgi:hypothetical protein